MRGDEGLGVLQQGVIRRRRLLIQHVGGITAHGPGIQRGDYVRHVHQFGTGGVHHQQILFRQGDPIRPHQVLRALAQVRVQAQHIDLRQHCLDGIMPRHPILGRERFRPIRVQRMHLHAEGQRPLRHFLADPAQPHDAHALVPDLVARHPLPLACAHRVRAVHKIPHQRQKQAKGVLRHRRVIHARREQHRQLPRRALLHIDLVQADPILADHPQPGLRLVQHRFGDLVITTEKRIKIPRQLQHAGFRQRSALPVNVKTRGLQQRMVIAGSVLITGGGEKNAHDDWEER